MSASSGWTSSNHTALVNFKEGILQIGEEEVPLRTPQVSEPNCYRCCVGLSVILSPKSDSDSRPALVEGDWMQDSRWAVLQPEQAVFSQ